MVAASLWLAGCGKPPAVSDAHVYTIYAHKVSLNPPKDWKERQEKSSGETTSTASPAPAAEVAAVVFEPPTGYGHIAVTVTPDMPQTKEVMNLFANGVRARQGTILKQWYEHKLNDPDKENAYHMEYELKDAGAGHPIQKGMQVQIFDTQKKVLYSLVFTADPAVYEANKATFLELVKSFELAP